MKLAALSLLLLCGTAHAQTAYECAFTDRMKPEKLSFTFIHDVQANKAYMVGNVGSSELTPIRNMDGGYTFIEVTNSGNVTTTTISSKNNAVHSRNMIFLGGDILASQYLGKCVRK